MFGWLKRLFRRKDSAARRQPGRQRIQVANIQGIGARSRQEDAFAFANALDEKRYTERGMMFCVCDGMGGMRDGKLASETAVKSFRESFIAMNRQGNLSQQLKQSFHIASDKVAALLGGNGGSTAVVGIIYQGQLFFASTGDSFLYLLRDSKLLRLNTVHNMAHLKYLEAIRNGQLDPSTGRNHAEAAALTGFLGLTGYTLAVDGTTDPLPLRDGDILLACSDGVGGVLSQTTLIEAMMAPTVQKMCSNIEQRIEAYARPHQDNYTALVIGYNQ